MKEWWSWRDVWKYCGSSRNASNNASLRSEACRYFAGVDVGKEIRMEEMLKCRKVVIARLVSGAR